MDGTHNRAEAGLRCDLADALLAMGELDAAQSHLYRADQLVTMTGSRRHRRRVKELIQAATRAPR